MLDKLVEDVIIKNPARNRQPAQEVDYIPEYIKKGIAPVPHGNSNIYSQNHEMNTEGFQKPSVSIPLAKDTPQINELVLMVFGKILCHGSEEFVLREVKALLYGENPRFADVEVSIDDVIILKRLGLKIGVFLDE